MLKVHCDGSAKPSPPNPTARGYFAFVARDNEFTQYRHAGYLGKAPWMAARVVETITLLKAMDYVIQQQKRARITSDCHEAVRFIHTGQWEMTNIGNFGKKYLRAYRAKLQKRKRCKIDVRKATRSEVRIPHYLCKLTHRGVTKGGISLQNAEMHVNKLETEGLRL